MGRAWGSFHFGICTHLDTEVVRTGIGISRQRIVMEPRDGAGCRVIDSQSDIILNIYGNSNTAPTLGISLHPYRWSRPTPAPKSPTLTRLHFFVKTHILSRLTPYYHKLGINPRRRSISNLSSRIRVK